MKNLARTVRTLICGAVLGVVAMASLSTVSQADTGTISLVEIVNLLARRTNLYLWSSVRPKLGCNTSCLTPYGRGFASESSVIGGGDEVTTGVECVVDGTLG